VEGFLSLPIGADSRPIPIGRPRLSGAGRKRALGRHRPGRGICGVVYLPHRAMRALAGCGPSVATKIRVFLWNFLQNKFSIFLLSFEQISNSLFYSNYSNEKFV
jgi:hypothetical protein